MKKSVLLWVVLPVFFTVSGALCLEPGTRPADGPSIPLDEIIRGIEIRYDVKGFSARFDQASTLKAMQITDTAAGNVRFKQPGKMRWEYEEPEKQQIITDGKTLWIYRPEENQVMIGDAMAVFGDGKGASFLSDIKTLRQRFHVSFSGENEDHIDLKLVPKESNIELSEIFLTVSKETFDAVKVTTFNPYGDETVIRLSKIKYNQDIDDAGFEFDIPENTEILSLGQ